ncbi:MAG: serine/threonine protein kinase [Acidobacteria bacterium]|nr:serine/threonine protein kinase [Acidobacteriota bacterium]
MIDRVGRGGMGTVYRALDETLHREVAIKVLNAELNDPEVAKRFRAEAITVARLSHPGIATIYELFQHDGQWLMVMEFVRGETLEQLVARAGGLTPEQAAALCMQSLAALAHAHSMGVVHRDLKPANIMRTEGGDIKIMDFGIARVSGSEHLTSVGFMMGTPAYMAPEQVMGHEIDARADLYAIGVVFFRLLTGQLPFKGDTPFAMAQAQVNAPPTPIDALRQDLPSWVGEVLSRSLEKKPEDRFQSATEFHETLQRAVSGATPPSSYQSLAPTGLVSTPSRAMPTGVVAETMMATPAAMPSGRVGTGSTPGAYAASGAVAIGTASTPAVAPRPGTAGVPVVPAPPQPVASAGIVQPELAAVGDTGTARAGGRTLVIGAAAAILLVVAGGAWWVMSSGDTAPVVTGDAAPVTPLAPETAAAPATAPPAAAAAPAVPVAGRAAAASGGSAAGQAAAARAGGPGRSSAPAGVTTPEPPPVDAAPAVEIANVKVLLVEGRRAVDQDATLNLGNGRIVAVSKRDGSSLVTWPYDAVTSVTYVHARSPRWNAELAAPPDNLDVGGMFRASRHYLTLQNATEFAILRAEDINVIQVIRELESRTGLTIRRSAGEQD